MSTTQCSLELGNERYIQACTLDNGERRVDMREWKSSENRQFPTKKGICLNPDFLKRIYATGIASSLLGLITLVLCIVSVKNCCKKPRRTLNIELDSVSSITEFDSSVM